MKLFLPILLFVLITGCVSTGDSEVTEYYSLSAPNLRQQPTESANRKIIVLGPLDFADYLKRPSVVTLESKNKSNVSLLHQWAGDIENEFQIALIKNFIDRYPEHIFVSYPSYINATPERQLKVDILRFDAESGRQARLEAIWFWLDNDQNILASGRFSRKINAGLGMSSIAENLSELVGLFAADIGQHLQKLESQR